MATPAAFSRLQLAAALLEYDNDPDDPYAPYRSAQDSAIFAHFRRNPAAKPGTDARRSDYIDLSFPSELGSTKGRESMVGTQRSRQSLSSVNALRNPFNGDLASETHEGYEEEESETGEVDLSSWGLEVFIPKDKTRSTKSRKTSAHAVESTGASVHPAAKQVSQIVPAQRGRVTSKSVSVGGLNEYFDGTSLPLPRLEAQRRASFASPLDLVGMEASGILPHAAHAASPTDDSMLAYDSHSVPFPGASQRAPSPTTELAYRDGSATPEPVAQRRYSAGSMNSRQLLDDAEEERQPRSRNLSGGSAALLGEDNPFAIENPVHTSRFDPKSAARSRRLSNTSMGTIQMMQNDVASTYTRDKPYSTFELLRPKVLVMPSPLQSVAGTAPPPARVNVRDGFQLTTDGPPLPPGARSSRRMSLTFGDQDNMPLASNSFTPNPMGDLSLSQKIFRNTLAVTGSHGPYSETLPKATQDGEQVQLGEPREEPPPIIPPAFEGEPMKQSRPPGKLFGKSLIDDLESRKAEMRSKQRVFTGDDRPSMMDRGRSTLIDPATLKGPVRSSSYGPVQGGGLSRQNSLSMKPLLTFDDEQLDARPPGPRMASTRSVFGTDTLWERETAKLKEIEAQEKIDAERRRLAEEENERLRETKGKKKKKKKGAEPSGDELAPVPVTIEPRVSVEPPILPDIERAPRRAPPKPTESDSESDSDGEAVALSPSNVKQVTPSWHAGSSDEEQGQGLRRRTTGVGPRYRKQKKPQPSQPVDDSDEDAPLASTIHKAAARMAQGGSQPFSPGSDDEDQPLSRILHKAKSDTASFHHLSPRRQPAGPKLESSDDDEPLGLRASRVPHAAQGDEDDMPLAFHPEQQRRTQYQMLAQQQQHMMAQMQSNMFMSPGFMPMTPGYFPMMNPMAMMQPPMPVPSPPPVPDEAKFGLVDRWRRDVVVDD